MSGVKEETLQKQICMHTPAHTLTRMYLLYQQRGRVCTSQKYRTFKHILILSSTALISAVVSIHDS